MTSMSKLIVAYHKCPTGVNASCLVNYCNQSPVNVRDLRFEDREVIAAARRHVASMVTPLAAATTCKIAEADDKAKKLEAVKEAIRKDLKARFGLMNIEVI